MDGAVTDKATEVVMRWFDEVWNKADEAAIDELLSEHCSVHGLGDGDITCPDDFKVYHRQMVSLIEKINISLDRLISNGIEVSGIMRIHGIHKATGKPLNLKGSFAATICDGKIVSTENIVDFLPLFVITGILEEDALVKVLESGKL